MLVLKGHNPAFYEEVKSRNLNRQYGLLADSINIGIELQYGHEAVDHYLIWALNHVALANLSQRGGRYRQEPVYIASHVPPHFSEVPDQMDRYLTTLQENWYQWSAIDLAAYGLWRMLRIHPFSEGNGRTARAFAYYLFSVREGVLLPGTRILPERIREHQDAYYAALRAADEAWAQGHLDLSDLVVFLEGLLLDQLREASD